jgi:hypothetical protein
VVTRDLEIARERLVGNPFHVLGLRPGCTRAEIEQEGQKLLAMLELGLAAAARYQTPLGPVERTREKVRAALAELRDPDRRLLAELWAALEPAPSGVRGDEPRGGDPRGDEPRGGDPRGDEPRGGAATDDARPAAWREALSALGWRRP